MTAVYRHDEAAEQAAIAIFAKQMAYLTVIHIEISAG
jgi:hypothetical protein